MKKTTKSANLLWRLQHGELPPSLDPPVFWLLIGTNDFGNTWCSAEVTLIGILRVIEEIRLKKPGSILVVNSLLPRSYDKKNGYLVPPKKGFWNKKRSQGRPSLWLDIQAVNHQLEQYCNNHEKILFFNATDIFLLPEENEKRKIDKNLMGDYLHPSALGYKLWGDQIVKKLDELIHP